MARRLLVAGADHCREILTGPVWECSISIRRPPSEDFGAARSCLTVFVGLRSQAENLNQQMVG